MPSDNFDNRVKQLEQLAKELNLSLFAYHDSLIIRDAVTSESIDINELDGLEEFPRS